MRSPHVFPGLLTGLVYKRSKVRKFEGSSYGKEEKKTIFFNVYKALIVFVRKLSSSPLALLCYPHCSFVTVSFEIPLRVPPPSFLPSFLSLPSPARERRTQLSVSRFSCLLP